MGEGWDRLPLHQITPSNLLPELAPKLPPCVRDSPNLPTYFNPQAPLSLADKSAIKALRPVQRSVQDQHNQDFVDLCRLREQDLATLS